MNKQDFLSSLRKELANLPKAQIEEHITFYSEIIDDHIEDGLSEERAIAQLGSTKQIANQILADSPAANIETKKPRKRLKTWEVVVIVLGSPIWISLLLSALWLVLSLYVSLWCIVISLWSVFVSLCACSLGLTATGVMSAINGDRTAVIGIIGAGIVCAGLSIFMFFACKAATKGAAFITKKLVLSLKKCFIKKEAA